MGILPKLKTGEVVEVLSKEEILATLDADGTVAGMPFMPEMLQYCGKQLTVSAVAHKTCDTACRTGGRTLDRTVHLNGARCDGKAHGGCEADCNLFWREEWLKPVQARGAAPAKPVASHARACSEERLHEATLAASTRAGAPAYRCQATQLFAASKPLPWWDIRQYLLDVSTGNHRLLDAARVLWLAAVFHLLELPFGYRVFRSIYERVHRALTGRPAPQVAGKIPAGGTTPCESLNLAPGELVRVRQPAEIAATLNVANKNRGMWFGPELEPFCGESFRVRRRVTRIIDERSGQMLAMRSPCISLEGVVCRAHYSEKRLLCPRAITPYWRENWLERVGPRADQ
jgi:hypothetical protein